MIFIGYFGKSVSSVRRSWGGEKRWRSGTGGWSIEKFFLSKRLDRETVGDGTLEDMKKKKYLVDSNG